MTEGDWILLAKDGLKSLDKKISDGWPPYLLMKFRKWGEYQKWGESPEEIRLFQPSQINPLLISPSLTISIYPPEKREGVKLPLLEFGSPQTYHVNKAWVGPEKIINEFKKNELFGMYAKIFESQIS